MALIEHVGLVLDMGAVAQAVAPNVEYIAEGEPNDIGAGTATEDPRCLSTSEICDWFYCRGEPSAVWVKKNPKIGQIGRPKTGRVREDVTTAWLDDKGVCRSVMVNRFAWIRCFDNLFG